MVQIVKRLKQQIKNRANREDGQILITQEGAAGLSALPDSSVGKDSKSSSNFQANSKKKTDDKEISLRVADDEEKKPACCKWYR